MRYQVLTEREGLEMYRDFLDEVEPLVEVAGRSFLPSRVLEEMDPTAFAEGFHRFVVTCSESDSGVLEAEWDAAQITWARIGSVTALDRLEIAGFWTPDYLTTKLRRLRSAGLDRLVICIEPHGWLCAACESCRCFRCPSCCFPGCRCRSIFSSRGTGKC